MSSRGIGVPNLPRGSRPNKHRITLFREASTDFRRERAITEKTLFLLLLKTKYISSLFPRSIYVRVYYIRISAVFA